MLLNGVVLSVYRYDLIKRCLRCEQVIRWKLDSIGMNPTAESYLLLHRFGTVCLSTFYLLILLTK